MDNAVFYPICDIIPDDEGHGMIIGKIEYTKKNTCLIN